MMPDLGKYADAVLSAYGVSLALIFGLVALSLWQSRRALASLREIEARKDHDHGA
ncbi:heme exporter protein D [Poseidonocella pacifica]|uniref:Heme exporter protein D n=1 Tax=Poseidonocella pacifica TaxID=871651 RepID=A0A1I0VDT4_9RHOB|nr:heme exporter protein CcmD [Poseidonocella pacifica]SFA73746.1 heme exporter protein D [Poseidonocella pacifica]